MIEHDAPSEELGNSLPYATPAPPRKVGLYVWMTIVAAVLIALGAGLISFGALSLVGVRDDHAGPISVGLSALLLGGFLAAWCWRDRFDR